MSSGRWPAIGAAALAAAAIAGCGLGPGPSTEGEATLSVTRDYGARELVSASEEDPAESETVIRFLDREAEITTRYGGGFVQSIEGLAGAQEGGRRLDWFFYVNGVESPVGAAEVTVHGGDRIWWDYRDWDAAMRVPAVVGQWPEPFAQAAAGEDALPVRVECAAPQSACAEVARRLRGAGAQAVTGRFGGGPGGDGPRVLVGTWRRLRADPVAAQLEAGPATSGVFVRVRGGALHGLVVLNDGGDPVRGLGGATGLVAAVRDGEKPPTWLVTGGGARGVRAAVRALDGASLRHRYAVAVPPSGHAVGLPVGEGGAG